MKEKIASDGSKRAKKLAEVTARAVTKTKRSKPRVDSVNVIFEEKPPTRTWRGSVITRSAPIHQVVGSKELMQAVLEEAKAALQVWERKYRELESVSELRGVFSAIKAMPNEATEHAPGETMIHGEHGASFSYFERFTAEQLVSLLKRFVLERDDERARMCLSNLLDKSPATLKSALDQDNSFESRHFPHHHKGGRARKFTIAGDLVRFEIERHRGLEVRCQVWSLNLSTLQMELEEGGWWDR